jgi:uncharacterized beta-barrel protein YwiB (DUF1934 family)
LVPPALPVVSGVFPDSGKSYNIIKTRKGWHRKRMKRPIEVRVYGIQEIDGEEQKQEVVVAGEYYEQNGKRFLLYEEEAEEAKKSVRTIVKESSKCIEVVKNGYISVKMSFSEGGSFNSPYATPMGSVSLHTVTKKIEKTAKEDGFLWELSYSIYMDDQYIGENVLGMDVRFI